MEERIIFTIHRVIYSRRDDGSTVHNEELRSFKNAEDAQRMALEYATQIFGDFEICDAIPPLFDYEYYHPRDNDYDLIYVHGWRVSIAEYNRAE